MHAHTHTHTHTHTGSPKWAHSPLVMNNTWTWTAIVELQYVLSFGKMKSVILHLFVQESSEMAHPTLTRAFLQPAPNSRHAVSPRGPHPPIPPFLLAPNQFSKQIASTDNVPSFNDYSCNQYIELMYNNHYYYDPQVIHNDSFSSFTKRSTAEWFYIEYQVGKFHWPYHRFWPPMAL